MKQPDFGSTIIFCAVWIAMLALAGVSIRILGGLAVAGVVGVILAYFFYPVATVRIDEFLFGTGDNFQVENAMRTLTAGGLFGMGPGGGTRKFGLPEPHTDYIFSVIGEEFGLMGACVVVALFIVVGARGLRIAARHPDPFASLLAFGTTVLIVLQGALNIAVVLGCLPTKGLALPFISYGGSAMMIVLAEVGVLLSLAREAG
jgi:cell division protein FtsW